MSGRAASRRSCPGFTLVELLLSLGLTALVMALSLPFLHTAKRLWESAEREREARRAIDGAAAWIARDLRQAGYRLPGPPLLALGEGLLSYTISRDGPEPEAHRPANRRLVTVFLDGGDLKYRVQAPEAPPGTGWGRGSTQVLAPGVTAMRCSGVDRDGLETGDADRSVLVSCALYAGPGTARRIALRLRPPRKGPP